jgi:hypothetical protein
VQVKTFTEKHKKFLNERMLHTSGYLNTFVKDERRQICQEFLTQISQAIDQAYLDALAKDVSEPFKDEESPSQKYQSEVITGRDGATEWLE